MSASVVTRIRRGFVRALHLGSNRCLLRFLVVNAVQVSVQSKDGVVVGRVPGLLVSPDVCVIVRRKVILRNPKDFCVGDSSLYVTAFSRPLDPVSVWWSSVVVKVGVVFSFGARSPVPSFRAYA